MFAKRQQVAEPLLIGCVVLIAGVRYFFPALSVAVLTFSILAAMTWHLFDYEKDVTMQPATSLLLCRYRLFGWIGAYMIDLRNMPGGLWWLSSFFHHLDDRRGSLFRWQPLWETSAQPAHQPEKILGGLLGGVFFGTLISAVLVILWHSLGGPAVAWWQGAILGVALSALSILGDLGESMFKRQAGVKMPATSSLATVEFWTELIRGYGGRPGLFFHHLVLVR